MAEHSAVNRRVVGSSPTSGAKTTIESMKCEAAKKRLPILFCQVAVLVAVRIPGAKKYFCGVVVSTAKAEAHTPLPESGSSEG